MAIPRLPVPLSVTADIAGSRYNLVENHPLDIEVNAATREEAKKNVAHYHSAGESFLRYMNTTQGSAKVGSLLNKAPSFYNAVRKDVFGLSPSEFWETSGGGQRAASLIGGVLSLPSTFDSARTAWNSMEGFSSTSEGLADFQKRGKVKKALQDVLSAGEDMGDSAAMLAQSSPVLDAYAKPMALVSRVCGLGSNSLSLEMNIENLMKTRNALSKAEGASEDVKLALKQTETRGWIAVAKDIVAIASGALLFAMSGATVLAFSLAEVILKIWGKLYEEGMTWKPIDHLDSKHVQLLPKLA
jgi:hypothetical protein